MAELSPVEQALVAAVGSGELLNLTGRSVREIRAEVVRDVLLGRIASEPDPRGLRLRGAVVVGRLDLDGMRTAVRLRMRGCTFTGGLWLRGASLPLVDLGGSTLAGLLADDAVVDGSVLLWQSFTVTGLVSLVGARIGGKLDLASARLDGQGGAALVADRITVGSDLVLDDVVARGGAAAGTVQLDGARVGGRLSARRIQAANPAGPAISAANLHVTDLIDLSKGIDVRGHGPDGAVRLVGAKAGSLSLGAARLLNPTGWALSAHYLDVAGTVYLDTLQATGGLRVSGGRIGGQLNVARSVVDGGDREALAATRLQVAQAVYLDEAQLRSTGDRATVDLRSARIGGDLEMRYTRVANPGGTALRLNTTTVEGRAILSELVLEAGGLDLRDSTVGALHDDPAHALPDADGWVEANGLVYRGVPGRPEVTVADRLAWLGRMPAYAPQPYRQLAAAYQAAGHPEDARRVLVAQQEHLRRSGALTGWSRLRHRLFGLTLQYGYQPLRAVALLGLTLLVAVGLFVGLAGGMAAEPGGGRCPAVDRVGLAVDTAVPLVETGAEARCRLRTGTGAGQALAAAGWLLTLAGWGSATLVVAGYTGLVRRA